ncbi:DUF6455 family protein [Ruegeria lacuscaerulensis]|uniref:DUF6455 family protein n=1 Tax=Ruegeria lacuscaerulensis TaxID=55218 RepID=UPI00147F5301|nr:DUF6455 family protein [Ruegeria lacuscaerulensis]
MTQGVLGEVEKHFWLTRSVARCMNVSLSEAMAEDRLTADRYAELVTRCRASHCSTQCTIWLAAQQSEARSAPDFCPNADLLNALKV